ncbi:MAG: hypothetical protein R3270_11280, partial [Gammaproteobacteria bacterium]|nr:hypothetical protein [Gammaproteobacteria bacterium]
MNVAGFFQQASWRRDWPMPLVALFIAGGVAIPEVMSTGHGLLLIAALATMKWPRRELAAGEKTFAWLLVAYWAYGLLSFFLGGQTELGESVLGRDLRLLLAVPVIFLVARLRWDAQMAGTALALAGFLCGFSALVEYAWNGMGSYRVSGPTVSIVFGNVCAALAAFNMAAAAVARGVPGRLHALASVSAIYAVFLTSTRGALVSLIVAFTVTLFLLPIAGRFRKRSFFTYTVLLSLLVAALT